MYFIVKFSAFTKVLLIATVVSGGRISGNVTVMENDRNQSTQTTFERTRTEHVFGTRPLLADDVVQDDADMDIINVSRNFFRSTGDISEKMNIIKKYKQLVIDSINMKKETIVAEKDKVCCPPLQRAC